jgi:drug/metabolite transporter (DMT)-like permease
MSHSREHMEFGALVALVAGALSTGAASMLVRLTETGPTAAAFWRGCLALPLLAIWALLDSRSESAPREARDAQRQDAARRNARAPIDAPLPAVPLRARPGRMGLANLLAGLREPGFLLAGLWFAGDLALWHWSLLLTSVAASTLEASLAPLAVILYAWLRWKERPSARFLGATLLAFAGLLLMVSPKFGQGGSAFLGDALGLGTACFYAAYIVTVAQLRSRYSTGVVMFNSTVVFTLLLLPLGLTQKFLPDHLSGWAALAGCAVAAQTLGQGLIAYALAHLRPTFSSLGLLLQTLGAAASAWLVLGERLSAVQIIGALVIVGAITLARSARKATPTASTAVPASLGVVRD